MMRTAILLLSLVAIGESLVAKVVVKPKQANEEEGPKSAKELARIEEDKTGGNEISKARMRMFGKKMDFKKIAKAKKAGWFCQEDPSDTGVFARNMDVPKPSKKDLDLGGIIYITLGGHRKKWIEKVLHKKANKTARFKFDGLAPVKNAKDVEEYSLGKDAGYLTQQYSTHQADATRAVYLAHMQAIASITELAKQTSESKNETVIPNKPWLIMEDDSDFFANWKKKMTDVLHNTPSDWDMIKVGYWSERRCSDKLNEHVYAPSDPTASAGGLFYQGNQGYLVRPESVERIVTAMKRQHVGDVDGNFVHAGCRSGGGRNGGSKKHCFNLYAASEQSMAIEHHEMGSLRSMLAKVEPNLDNPWKTASSPEQYPFTSQ